MAEAGNEVVIEMFRPLQSGLSGPTIAVSAGRTRGGHGGLRIAGLETDKADLSPRMDRRDEQMERVSRRLDLADASH